MGLKFMFKFLEEINLKRTRYTNEKEKRNLVMLSKLLHTLHELGRFVKLGLDMPHKTLSDLKKNYPDSVEI